MNLTTFHLLSLGILSGLSWVIFCEDVKRRKIRNIWIIRGFGMGFLLMFLARFLNIITLDYFIKIIFNTVVSFFVGFGIWRLGLWPAGDSKLFSLFAFLIPFHYYQRTYFSYFPSFALLMNSFAIFLIFLVYKSSFFAIQSAVRFLGKETDKRKIWGEYFKKKKEELAGHLGHLGHLDNRNKFIYGVLQRIVGNVIFFLVIAYLLKRGPSFNGFQLSFLLFFAVTAVINFYIMGNSQQKMDTKDLIVGMNLSDETVSVLRQDKEFFREMGPLRAEGLEAHQVNLIKDYGKNKNIEQISIYQTIPFSPWIVSGALATILFKGSFVHLFYYHF